jgi:subfamily B ATP-binding cassette protein MsbA
LQNDNVIDADKKKATDFQLYMRLLSYLKGLRLFFLISIVGFIVFASTQAAAAHLLKYFVDGLGAKDAKFILYVPVALVVIAFIRGVGSFVGNYFISKVSLGVIHKIRCELFRQFVRSPKKYYDRTNVGQMMSIILYNVGQVSGAATDAIKVLIREGFTVTSLVVYLFWMNWKMTLFFMAVAPIIGIIVYMVGKRLKSISKRMQVSMEDITHATKESLSLFQLIKAYGGEQREINRFNNASSNNVRLSMKMVRTATTVAPLLQLIIAIAIAGLMYSVLRFFVDQSAGDVIAYITAAGLIPKPIRQMSDIWGMVQRGLAASESIFETLDSEVERDDGSRICEDIIGKIEIKHLKFSYDEGGDPLFDDLNLIIEPGKMVALVGESGGGKTSIISLLLRLYDYQDGGIFLDDVELKCYQLAELRKTIALVSQNVELTNDTVRANVGYGAGVEYTDEEIWKVLELANAEEFVKKLDKGLDAMVGENGARLSGGQRQRLAIARAILKDSPVLILDEATSALDSESERLIQEALVRATRNRTTIVVAHRLSTILNADRICVFEGGKLVESGSHVELMRSNGHYAKLYNIQFGSGDSFNEG